jgi:hypothetical protein
MTKHASGKHGRTIGHKEPKAGWPARASAWCYRCSGTHQWEEGCPAGHGDLAAQPSHSASHTALAAATLDRW